MNVTIVLPTFGAHDIVVKGEEEPSRIGGWMWGNPVMEVSGTRISFMANIKVGSSLTLRPVFDPPSSESDPQYWDNSCCQKDPTSGDLVPTCAVWATWDNNPQDGIPAKPAEQVTVEPADNDGCQLVLVAAPSPLISSTDMDGDGFNPNASNESQRDCDDSSNAVYPGQVESADDNIDLDCNGEINPARQIIRISGMSVNLAPKVYYDDARYPNSEPMTWKGGGIYETEANEMRLGVTEFHIAWPGTGSYCVAGYCYESSYYGSACHSVYTVQSYKDTTLDLIPVSLEAVEIKDEYGQVFKTCRRFIDRAELRP